jgi:hypothetical protein
MQSAAGTFLYLSAEGDDEHDAGHQQAGADEDRHPDAHVPHPGGVPPPLASWLCVRILQVVLLCLVHHREVLNFAARHQSTLAIASQPGAKRMRPLIRPHSAMM